MIYKISDDRFRRINEVAIAHSSIAMTYEWNVAISQSLGWPRKEPILLEALSDEKPIGYWVIIKRRLGFLKIITAYCEPCIIESQYKGDVWRAFLNVIKAQRPIFFDMRRHVFLRLKSTPLEIQNEFLKYADIEHFGSYIFNLETSKDVLWKNLHVKHRNVIRKAMKIGIIIEKLNNITEIQHFYNLLRLTYRRSNSIGPSFDHLKNLYLNLSKARFCSIYFAKDKEGKKLAAAFITTINGYATYLYGASIDNIPTGATNLLHWHIIEDLKKQNFKYYDLGGTSLNPPKGSKARNLQRFKERFGAPLQEFVGFRVFFKPWAYRMKSIIPIIVKFWLKRKSFV